VSADLVLQLGERLRAGAETDWYVSTTTRSNPTVSRSAISTGTSCMVEQLGWR